MHRSTLDLFLIFLYFLNEHFGNIVTILLTMNTQSKKCNKSVVKGRKQLKLNRMTPEECPLTCTVSKNRPCRNQDKPAYIQDLQDVVTDFQDETTFIQDLQKIVTDIKGETAYIQDLQKVEAQKIVICKDARTVLENWMNRLLKRLVDDAKEHSKSRHHETCPILYIGEKDLVFPIPLETMDM